MGDIESLSGSQEALQTDDLYTIEIGRLKERLHEGLKLLPAFLKLNLQIFVAGMLNGGKSEEEIETEIDRISAEVMARSDALKKQADERYERNVLQKKKL